MLQGPGRDRARPTDDHPDPADDRFAIPELCTPAALSLLVIAAELLALVVTLLGSEPDWLRFAVVSLFVQWSALGSAGVLCLSRHRLARMPTVLGGFCSWLLVVLVISGFALIGELALTGTLGAAVRSLFGMSSALAVGEPDWARMMRNSVVGALMAGMVLRYLFVQQTLRAREQSQLRLRLQALQSRIRPHFLFNSMNIIASLIETDPETAETVVEDLSVLFRASLGEPGNQVPLAKELDLCDRYVRIEQLRLGDRLRIHWDLDPVPAGLEIPLLTLQPLLENAIYHGIQPLPEGGTIEVALRIVGGRVEFLLVNPLPPRESPGQAHDQGNRMALANIRSRLAVLYGPAARLDAGIEGERFVTRLSYPVGRGGEAAADDRRS